MRCLIFSDVHWNTDSSIIRSRGKKYSVRLEHLISSLNYANEVATKQNCSMMFCLGDFFNKAQVSDEEVTALREIAWNNLPCYFICGNHESSVSDLRFNTIKIFESAEHFIISEPTTLDFPTVQFHMIPYITESERKPIEEYLINKRQEKQQFIFAHSDIQGIQYGGFESKSGFSIAEIEKNCDMFLNGHLHNSEWITKKILNVGSCSCHNFTNDASKYNYGFWILDTNSGSVEFIDNIYGFNFYKLNIETENDLRKLENLKNNGVLSISCSEKLLNDCTELLNSIASKIIEKRIIVNRELSIVEDKSTELIKIDHIQKLIDFCYANIDNTDILAAELSELSK